MAFIVIMLVMLAFMYLLLIRPQRRQQRRHQSLLDNLQPGDEVITAGGIYGDVQRIEEEKVHLLIAEDVEIEVARKSIATVVPQDVPVLGEGAEEADEPAALGEATDHVEQSADPPSDAELEEAGRSRGAQPRQD